MKCCGFAFGAALTALCLFSAGPVLAEEKPARASMVVGQKGSSDESRAAEAKTTQAQAAGDQQAGKSNKPARECKKAKGRKEEC